MKGFVYLIEVAIAGLLAAMALAAFLSTTTMRTSWERPDLIALGDSVLWSLEDSGELTDVLAGDTSNLTRALPFNVRWALHVLGTPKTRISIGCSGSFADCSALAAALSPQQLNGRQISFDVEEIADFSALAGYDVLYFTQMPAGGFDNNVDIQDYVMTGGGLIANMDMADQATFNDMDATFDLTAASITSCASTNYFMAYAPATSTIPKYFNGFGIDIATPYTVGTKKQGTWRIWGQDRQVNITSSQIEVQAITETPPITAGLGGTFVLKDTMTGVTHSFDVRRLSFADGTANVLPVDTAFAFQNFDCDARPARSGPGGIDVVVNGDNNVAVTASRNTVWISRPATSSETALLLKAVVASLATDWWVTEPVNPREPVTATAFVPLSPDTPETVELELWLWYAF